MENKQFMTLKDLKDKGIPYKIVRLTKEERLRKERNLFLEETDKYMTMDYPLTEEQRAQLAAYRQALRDLPEQEGFPDVEMPTKPF